MIAKIKKTMILETLLIDFRDDFRDTFKNHNTN